MTPSEFDSYWFRIEQDRATVRGAITRCMDDGEEPAPEPEPTPEPTTCDPLSSEFVWGSRVVAPIKNQGSCGSCYAFSAVQVLESALAIASGDPVRTYSEQQIVDCQAQFECCGGCAGGWPIQLHVETREHPIVLESVYPYTAREARCLAPASSSYAAATNVYWIDESPAAVKRELCHGPIQVALKAAGAFSWYDSGVLTSANCPYA